MTIQYLTVDIAIEINKRCGGAGSGVIDRAGLEAAVARPESGFGDTEFFPDLWSKAAVLLHGIASTQYFSDGNKRTAWLAALTFLELNGVEIRHVPGIEAEPFVLSVATGAFEVTQAAEWFKYQQQSEVRLFSTMLCDHVVVDGTFEIHKGGITYIWAAQLPEKMTLHLAVVLTAEFGVTDDVVLLSRVYGPRGESVRLFNYDEEPSLHWEASHLAHLQKSGPAVEGEPWQQNLYLPLHAEIHQPGRHRLQLSLVPARNSPMTTVSLPFAIAVAPVHGATGSTEK